MDTEDPNASTAKAEAADRMIAKLEEVVQILEKEGGRMAHFIGRIERQKGPDGCPTISLRIAKKGPGRNLETLEFRLVVHGFAENGSIWFLFCRAGETKTAGSFDIADVDEPRVKGFFLEFFTWFMEHISQTRP